jgi:hypothetical protein
MASQARSLLMPSAAVNDDMAHRLGPMSLLGFFPPSDSGPSSPVALQESLP